MKKDYQNAALRLHEFASENPEATEIELRAELEGQGVDVNAFLTRLANEAGIRETLVPVKKPTAAERLRAIASRAGSKMKNVLSDLKPNNAAELPVGAYGRSGRRGKGARKSSRGKPDDNLKE